MIWLFAIVATPLFVLIAIVLWVALHIRPKPPVERFATVTATVVDQAEDLHLHGSSIAYLPNGRLGCVWFKGTGERNRPDVHLCFSQSDDGEHWDKPVVIHNTPGQADINPVLWIDNDKLTVFFHRIANKTWASAVAAQIDAIWADDQWQWQSATDLNLVFDPDYPEQFKQRFWQNFRLLWPASFSTPWVIGRRRHEQEIRLNLDRSLMRRPLSLAIGWFAKHFAQHQADVCSGKHDAAPYWLYPKHSHPITLQDGWQTRYSPLVCQGKVLLPLYSDHLGYSQIFERCDDGSWKAQPPLTAMLAIQPTLVDVENKLVCLMRNNGFPPKRILSAESSDAGQTWSPVMATSLPSPATAADAIAWRDTALCVYNDSETDRRCLALGWYSGGHWQPLKRLLSHPSESYGYPAMAKDNSDNVYISFTNPTANSGRICCLKLSAPSIERWLAQDRE
ncbi:MAG: exo-alpha-sialidase [Gammaproteobacteria bacterium]|nr:exo-alpha-sialidase [Gammaproteobacteria bacterium]